MPSYPQLSQLTRLLLAYFLGLVMVIITAGILANSYNHIFKLQPAATTNSTQFIAIAARIVKPKPKENFIFIVSLLLLPLNILIAIKMSTALINNINKKHYALFIKMSLSLFCCMLFLMSAHYCPYIKLILPIHSHFYIFIIMSVFFASLYFYPYLQTSQIMEKPRLQKTSKRLTWALVVSAILIQCLAYRLCTLADVDTTGPWSIHFNTAFYSVAQVVNGNTLLINLPAQYGMYSEVLNPLFKCIGLSIFKFSLVMAISQAIALYTLFSWQKSLLKSNGLIFLSMLSLCLITGLTWYFIGNPSARDPYYQYYPIRFFFPAISLYVCHLLSNHKNIHLNIKAVQLAAIMSALAVIWNSDTGIPIFIVLTAYLSSFILFPTQEIARKKIAKLIVIFIGVFLLALLSFLFYIAIKGNGIPHLSWIVKYQKIFYVQGVAMLPMPQGWALWKLIIGLYILGLTSAILSWLEKRRTTYSDMCFCVSLLGLGLFSYYAGRAHISNLIQVSWPAIIIVFMFCDRVYQSIEKNTLPPFFIIPCLPILLFGISATILFIYGMPKFYRRAETTWNQLHRPQDSLIIRNIAFIKKHSAPKQKTLILLENQATYYGESGTASALTGPGLTEILLKSDQDDFNKQLMAGVSKTVFIKLNDHSPFIPHEQRLLKAYHIVDVSKDGVAFLVLNRG